MKIIATGRVPVAPAPIRLHTGAIVLERTDAIAGNGAGIGIVANDTIVLRRTDPEPARRAAPVLANVVRLTERLQRATTPTAFRPLAGRSWCQ